MAVSTIIPFVPKPGFQRDGVFVSKHGWQEGQWTRFQYGLPRKMGGCKYLCGREDDPDIRLDSVPRGIAFFAIEGGEDTSQTDFNFLLCGTKNKLVSRVITRDNIVSRSRKINPLGWEPNDNTLWQFDSFSVTSTDEGTKQRTSKTYVLAFPGQNKEDIQSNIKSNVYFGEPGQTTFSPLLGYIETETPNPDTKKPPIITDTPIFPTVSGGIVVLYPYIFLYGSAGELIILDTSQTKMVDVALHPAPPAPIVPPDLRLGFKIVEWANISSSKIVAAKVIRGSGNGPSALLWTLDSLIRVSFSPISKDDQAPFRFDTISDQISILSSNSVMEYDGVFFWAATNRFLMYDGLVREVPNTQNFNYFTEALSFKNRQKVWTTKIPRYGEIWWFYVSTDQTTDKNPGEECDRALIFNVREKAWYDTKLPTFPRLIKGQWTDTQATRSCGCYTQNFASPIWGEGTSIDEIKKTPPEVPQYYSLWEHEFGTDQAFKEGSLLPPAKSTQPIKAYVKTAPFSWVVSGSLVPGAQAQDRCVYLDRVELDIDQKEEMKLTVSGKRFARGEEVISQIQKDNVKARTPKGETPEEGGYYFDPEKIKIDLREQRREMMLKFESNALGGDFIFGVNLLTVAIGDGRP